MFSNEWEVVVVAIGFRGSKKPSAQGRRREHRRPFSGRREPWEEGWLRLSRSVIASF